LVTIPVLLYPTTRREELKFRLLRKSDQSPVNYKRVAEADGKEVTLGSDLWKMVWNTSKPVIAAYLAKEVADRVKAAKQRHP